jgi:sec-independent protein translocase protein TatC
MEDYYPYTGYEQYTGGPTVPDSSTQERSSSVPREDENAFLVPVTGIPDVRRLSEMDLTADEALSDTAASGAGSGYREAKVAYCHDRQRISVHPLGSLDIPDGLSERFWKRLPEGCVIISPDPETGVAEEIPDTSEKDSGAVIKRIEPVSKPEKITSGGGSGGSGASVPPSEEEKEAHDPTEMPFLDHLEELRWSILKSIIVIVIAMIASWYLSDWFYNQITDLAKGGKSFLGNSNSVNIAISPLGRHPGQVTGVVTDMKTKKTVTDAAVTLNPGGITARSDSLGRYTIEGIPEGSYTVTATKEGYTPNTRNAGIKLVMTTVMEPLIIRLQMALVMGLILALPLVFYFLWSFVSPGLYSNEKKWVLPLIFASTGCFFVGSGIAWFIVVPYMLKFMQTFMPLDVEGMFTFSKFLGLILKFTLSFGIIFELPMVTFVLAKIGILKYQFMAKYRGYAIVFIFIISAIITPTVDPVSQTLMAIPLYLLYEISILVARFAGRKTLI